LELISEKIDYFSLPGQSVVRLDADTMKNSSIRTGFYDVLYDGRVKFYVKRHKEKKEEIAQGEIQVEFIEIDRLYIHKQGPVHSGKNQIFRFGRISTTGNPTFENTSGKNKIHFRKQREEAIARLFPFTTNRQNRYEASIRSVFCSCSWFP